MKRLLKVLLIIVLAVLLFVSGYLFHDYFSNASHYGESTNFAILDQVYQILLTKFYYGENSESYRDKIIEDAINGMVNAQNDPHTIYMTKEELEKFKEALSNSVVGIGVSYYDVDNKIFVVDVLKNSPAEAAGIMVGDFIIGVDDYLVEDVGVDKVVEAIKGDPNTKCICKILRDNQQIDISVTRNEINDTVYSKIKDDIGILTISTFADGTAQEAYEHLNNFKENNVDKLIIDLRGNGGGYANTLNQLCCYFMNDGDIIMRESDREGNEIIDKVNYYNLIKILGKQFNKYEYKNIVILVNGNSASCSEVFTLAMKENCGAIVVGETTYGKGVAQVTTLFADGSAMKYTDVIWKSGNGVSIAGDGIKPDVEVYLDDILYFGFLNIEDDKTLSYDQVDSEVLLLQKALKYLGYNVDRSDGYFSKTTEEVLKQFEKDHGLTVDGILSNDDCGKINCEIIRAYRLNPYQYDAQLVKAIEVVKN